MSYKTHQAPMYVGTNSERSAQATAPLRIGTLWYETDTDNIYLWSGTQWKFHTVDLNGQRILYDSDEDSYEEATTDDEVERHIGGSLVGTWDADGLKIEGDLDTYIGDLGIISDWLGGLPSTVAMLDHFTSSSLNALWDAWTTTPSVTVDPDYLGHFLEARPDSTQNGVTCFLYTDTVLTTRIACQCLPQITSSVSCGVRWDNGSDNTFYEGYYKSGIGSYNGIALFERYQDAGGGITETQLTDPIMPFSLLPPVMIQQASTTSYNLREVFGPRALSSAVYGTGWTPTRSGIFVRLNVAGDRSAYFNWFGGD